MPEEVELKKIELKEGLAIGEDYMKYFRYEHLREDLQATSKPFHDLAAHLVETLPSGGEKIKALDHVLYAKDAAVRAVLYPLPLLEEI